VRTAAAVAVALALILAPGAGATGVTYTIVSGTSGDNGWYRSAVVVKITSDSPPCPPLGTMLTFNTSSDSFSCTSGGVTLNLQFNIDTDAPVVTAASTDRAPDHDGWYTHPVNVAFSGTDSTSGIASCTAGTFGGPDSATATATGTCRDKAGNVSSPGSFQLKYDATPPTTTATPGRQPNVQGWYSKPVTVTFGATDATSGVAACTPAVRYKGPDSAAATLTGTCTDQAGNQSSASVALKYDATPPRVMDVTTTVSGNAVLVRWERSPDTRAVTVLRAPGRGKAKVSIVYHGPAATFRDKTVRPGVTYHYTVATTDAAGNDARVKIAGSLTSLYAPAAGARVRAGTTLAWTAAPKATYYNLQLFRGKTKVLSTWPVAAHFRLPRSWSFGGRHYKLQRGSYTWYVWPGLGPRAKARYGKLLGSSTFTVR